MTECKGCGGEEMWRDYSRGQDDWCLLCQIVTPHLDGGQMPWMIRSIEEGETLRRKLGSPDCRPARVWRAIRLLESDAADWAFNDGSRGSDGDDEGRSGKGGKKSSGKERRGSRGKEADQTPKRFA